MELKIKAKSRGLQYDKINIRGNNQRMKYGYFDDTKKEYVIKRPDTPLPWINYLGCEDFFGIISNTAGGYCFYQDARLRRLTRYRYNNVPLDGNGRYLYIKDGDTIWNPMWKPMRVELDEYECRHGMGYTRIKGVKNGLVVTVTFFVPIGSTHEVWDVKIQNTSNMAKSIRLWSFVEWCLWDAFDDMTNFQRNYSIGEVEVEDEVIFHLTEYRERRDHYAYFSCSRSISGFDTNRDAFVGTHNGLENPQAVLQGECMNSMAYGWAPVGAHQIDLNLKPNDEKSLFFLLGYAENPPDKKFKAPRVAQKQEFTRVRKHYQQAGTVDSEFQFLKEYWDRLLSSYQVVTEDTLVNRMVNIWNQYQCMTTFNLSRSASFYESGIGRGMGFRDSNQDILGFVHMVPDRVRQRLLDLAATQLSDGTCFHQYQPLTKKGNADIGGGFNDDPLWLVLATSAYIKESGDLIILKEKIGYADLKNSQATLLDHLEKSIQYILEHRGPHGLPQIGHADWNDCLNLNCFSTTPGESFQTAGDISAGDKAESVMIAGLFCVACEDLAGIYRQIEQTEKAETCLAEASSMRHIIHKHGWDGEWFLRAYDAESRKIGSKDNEEGRIFIESQGWCIMGGAGRENGYAQKALDSVKEHLATPNGIILQQPAFQEYQLHLGEITSFPPGYKENAGIFAHNNTWIQIAETMLGHGDQAFDYYLSICPSNKDEQIDIYRGEPYAYCQMIAGPDAPTPGECKNTWLTGTAAWSFVVISQYILGIQADHDGLRVDPCIPSGWKEFSVKRIFRSKTCNIKVMNKNGVQKGVKHIYLNGEELESNLIPLEKMKDTNDVLIEMG
ncbi:MAG: hypothetical protein JW860_01450 [Sedimentisphaerales bacterium]|nr:hypothetical protein [Sedimentisphaerales bacterium]